MEHGEVTKKAGQQELEKGDKGLFREYVQPTGDEKVSYEVSVDKMLEMEASLACVTHRYDCVETYQARGTPFYVLE